MAFRPTLRLIWQRPLYRLALLGLLTVGMVAWYVASRGGWANTFGLPPVLDASTPRTQYGFTLVAIKTPGDEDREDAAVLLIRPPAFPQTKTSHYGPLVDGSIVYGDNFESVNPTLQASGQTSTGDVTPLNWKIVGDRSRPQFYRVEIPGGYSNESRSITVTLVPGSGPFPRWRITRLPNMRCVIPDHPETTESITKNDITATARAWRTRHWIYLQVRPLLPANSHQWELATNNQWSEWETFNQPHGQWKRQPIEGRNGVFTHADLSYIGPLTNEFSAPYRSASQYVRADCELRQFETYDERVTFHNVAIKQDLEDMRHATDKAYYLVVPHPMTITTPSGISVTLPAQGQTRPEMMYTDSLNFHLSLPPLDQLLRPAHSPLSLQFGKPVQLILLSSPTNTLYGQQGSGGSDDYHLSRPLNPQWSARLPLKKRLHIPFFADFPPMLKDFTVIVRQRVDLQTIPMTFTVPVSDTPPDVH